MKIGEYYMVIKFPSSPEEEEYYHKYDLKIGTTCQLTQKNKNNVILTLRKEEFEVEIAFFNDHFQKINRNY